MLPLGHILPHSPVDFLWGELFFDRRDGPDVSERVLCHAEAVAPEGVLWRHDGSDTERLAYLLPLALAPSAS